MTPAPARKNLPEGWRWVRLGDVVREAQGGFACGERDPEGVLQLRMNNVTKRGQFDWSSALRVPSSRETLEMYGLQEGDVLFNNTNSTELVGKTALFERHTEPVVFSNHFTRLRTADDLLMPGFLALWLQEQWQRRLFADICNRWIGQSAVQRDKLLALEMPLPQLAEQKRITGILAGRLAGVERARAATEAQLEAARALPAAYLRAAFGNPQAESWPRRRLAETSRLLPSKSIANDGDAVVQAITTACLTESGFQPRGVKTARMWTADVAECTLSPSEILVARSNTPDLVGRASLFPGAGGAVVASDLTVRIRPGESMVPSFLAYYLSFLYTTGYWKERAGGASGSMKKITRAQILAEQIPTPTIAQQTCTSDSINGSMAVAQATCEALEQKLAAINALPAALLRRAFSGEL